MLAKGWVIAYVEAQFNSTQVIAGFFVLMAVVALMDFDLKRLEDHFSYWKPLYGGRRGRGIRNAVDITLALGIAMIGWHGTWAAE